MEFSGACMLPQIDHGDQLADSFCFVHRLSLPRLDKTKRRSSLPLFLLAQFAQIREAIDAASCPSLPAKVECVPPNQVQIDNRQLRGDRFRSQHLFTVHSFTQ